MAAVYVGYTNCPDVCPTTMADLAVAVRSLTEQQRADVDVIMVTSDPDRDTPTRMRQWLDAFDRSFVGLTGAYADVQQAATEMGIPIEPPVTQPDGTVVVDHGAQVLLYGRTGPARLIFTSGFTPSAVAHDIALLLEGTQP
ncbi:MAG: SCO family protein [Actinomycetia bacterium]|nr:SCO family protein [Actinomycetes bacterium]